MPGYMDELIANGVLGRKTGGGFFKRGKDKQKLVLDPKSGDYVPESSVKLPDLAFIDEIAALHRYGDYRQAMAKLVAAPGPEAALARKVVAAYISYAFHRVGEVTDSIRGIDLIMGFGFNWAPPGVLVDTIGVTSTVAMLKQAGVPVPEALERAAAADERRRFFNEPGVGIGKFFVAA